MIQRVKKINFKSMYGIGGSKELWRAVSLGRVSVILDWGSQEGLTEKVTFEKRGKVNKTNATSLGTSLCNKLQQGC